MKEEHKNSSLIFRQIDPPINLYNDILIKIRLEKTKVAKKRLFMFGGTAIASLILMIPAVQYFIGEVNQSGFYQYLSLIFSDWNLITVYWNEFALSLAETMPVLGITTVLATIFIFLEASRLALKNGQTAFFRFHTNKLNSLI